VKIDSVASSLATASAREMMEALIAGQRTRPRWPIWLAGVVRRKLPELEMACDGRFTSAHAQMCRLHLDAYDHLTGWSPNWTGWSPRPQSRSRSRSPGCSPSRTSGSAHAQVIVAETGGDMTRFGTQHPCGRDR